MSAYLITSRKTLVDMVGAALKTGAVHHFTEAVEALALIVRDGHSKSILIILDLTTIADSERFISFIKSSSSVRSIPIIGIGRVEDYQAIAPGALAALAGMLHVPCNAVEIAALAARVREERLSE
jgi:hypothetical protein